MTTALGEVLDQIQDESNQNYRFPSHEAIQAYGNMGEARQHQLVAQAKELGQEDARRGALLDDVYAVPQLEELLDQVPDGMARVAGARENIEEDIKKDIAVLETAIAEADGLAENDEYKRQLANKHMDLRSAESSVRHLDSIYSPSRWVLLISVVVAVAGVIIDAIFLGSAIERAEITTVNGSRILGFVAAIALSALALVGGLVYGKSKIADERLESSAVPEDQQKRYNAWADQRASRAHRDAVISWAFVGVGLFVFFLLAMLRFAEWRTVNQTTGDSPGDSGGITFGTGQQVADSRADAIWVQAAIMVLALLSLLVFWYEGYQLALSNRKKQAAEQLDKVQREFQDLEDEASAKSQLETCKNELQNDLDDKLDCEIGYSIEALVPLWNRILKAYRGAAMTFLQGQKDDTLKAQISSFDGLDPKPPTYTAKVQSYLNLIESGECRQVGRVQA